MLPVVKIRGGGTEVTLLRFLDFRYLDEKPRLPGKGGLPLDSFHSFYTGHLCKGNASVVYDKVGFSLSSDTNSSIIEIQKSVFQIESN